MGKILWLDTETTGTDPKENGLIQLAFIIEVDNKIKAIHDFKVQPFKTDRVDKEALEINKTSLEEIKKYPLPYTVYRQVIEILSSFVDKYDRKDKFYPAGFNVQFDLNFLARFFEKNDDKYFGSFVNWRRLDPLSLLYMLDFKGFISLPNYKLQTVCDHFNIQIDAHDALSDIKATRLLTKGLLEHNII